MPMCGFSSDSIAHETEAMEKIQEERENYFKVRSQFLVIIQDGLLVQDY